MYLFAPTASASSNENQINQSEATFHNNIRFATVIRSIFCRTFSTLSNQTSGYIRECIRMLFILEYRIIQTYMSVLIGIVMSMTVSEGE